MPNQETTSHHAGHGATHVPGIRCWRTRLQPSPLLVSSPPLRATAPGSPRSPLSLSLLRSQPLRPSGVSLSCAMQPRCACLGEVGLRVPGRARGLGPLPCRARLRLVRRPGSRVGIFPDSITAVRFRSDVAHRHRRASPASIHPPHGSHAGMKAGT